MVFNDQMVSAPAPSPVRKPKPAPAPAISHADLAPRPTATEQLTTQLSESQVSPVQAALQAASAPKPLDISGSAVEAMLASHGVPEPLQPQQVEDRAAQQEAETGRDLRETALSVGSEHKGRRIVNQLQKMTEGQYDVLTPQQRAAVDFNRMLVDAVHKDRRSVDDAAIGGKHPGTYQPTEEQRDNFDQALKDVFGEDTPKPSMFAPETLGVLRQIGYHDDNATLDDFLNLDAAIGRKQIERMAPETIHLASEHTGPLAPSANPAPGLSPLASETQREKYNLATTLAYDTSAMQSAMANTQPLLASITDVAKVERNDDVTQLGGTPNKVKPTVGYGNAQYDDNGVPQDLNSYFQLAFEKIASKEMDPKSVLADANSLLSPEEFRQLHTYMANRAVNAQRYELPLGANPKATYMKPEQFLKLLKLDQPGGE